MIEPVSSSSLRQRFLQETTDAAFYYNVMVVRDEGFVQGDIGADSNIPGHSILLRRTSGSELVRLPKWKVRFVRPNARSTATRSCPYTHLRCQRSRTRGWRIGR